MEWMIKAVSGARMYVLETSDEPYVAWRQRDSMWCIYIYLFFDLYRSLALASAAHRSESCTPSRALKSRGQRNLISSACWPIHDDVSPPEFFF